MPIISEGLDDVGTGPQKIAVQPYNGVGMIQNGFWNESAGLHITSPPQLEQIAFRANHSALV